MTPVQLTREVRCPRCGAPRERVSVRYDPATDETVTVQLCTNGHPVPPATPPTVNGPSPR